MSALLTFLDHLLLQPLLVISEALYVWAFNLTGSHGAALLLFSIVLNAVLTPIYLQMDRAGRSAQLARQAMDAEAQRLKKHYKGRERFYYLRTLHRIYGYHPFKVVLGSTDLILQVVVFATVFRFLSNHEPLQGASFWVFQDLSQPDGLLFGVHVLPIIMTAVNVGSALLYGAEASKKRTSFLLAAVFLVLLYPSPSGLVLYWTWNNLFSLGRNLVQHHVVPKVQKLWLPAHPTPSEGR